MSNKRVDIYIEGERLDLYDDENIIINSSVQNINDISKVFTDFSQSFTVPASQKNNTVFRHWYNADIEGGFDARVKKSSNIEIATLPFRYGKMALENVSIKNNRPEDYTIRFFGNLISIAEKFGEDGLKDLFNLGPDEGDALDHLYDNSTVRTGMSTGLYGGKIIYPLISTTRKWHFDSSLGFDGDNVEGDHTGAYIPPVDGEEQEQPKFVNVAYLDDHTSGGAHGIRWTDLKPAVSTTAILERIQEKYGISFSQDFFGSGVLDNLYLWLSNGKGPMAIEKKIQRLDFTHHISGDTGFNFNTDSYDTTLVSTDTPEPLFGGHSVWNTLEIIPTDLYNDVSYTVYVKKTTDGYEETSTVAEGVRGYQEIKFITRLYGEGTLPLSQTLYIEAEGYMEFSPRLNIQKRERHAQSNDVIYEETVDGNFNSTYDILRIKDHTPEMKVKEFFSGLIKMFNLAIVPTSETDFYVNTIKSWYSDGKIIDITKYVDTSSFDVAKSKAFSSLKFKFEEDETVLIDKFREVFGRQYGDNETPLKDTQGNDLDGSDLSIEVGFGQMIFERLYNLGLGIETDIQYGAALNGDLEPEDTNPLLFYGVPTHTTFSLSVVTSSTAQYELNDVFTPSHVNDHSTKEHSTIFNLEKDEWDSVDIENTLYKKYYSDYVLDVFDPKGRKFTYKAKLPNFLLSKLELNDKLIIGETRFKINNLEINLTSNEVKLELLNEVYREPFSVPTISTDEITLAFGGSLKSDARDNWSDDDKDILYVPEGTPSFLEAQVLFSDTGAENAADNGYYTDGNYVRYWNGSYFTFSGGFDEVVTTKALTIAQNAISKEGACNQWDGNNRDTFYIPENETFASTDVIYLTQNGFVYTNAKYFSDGNIVRYWDGSAFTSTSTACLTFDLTYQAVQLSQHGKSSSTACERGFDGNTSTFYVPTGVSFRDTTEIFTSSSGTGYPSAQYYSDGEYSRYWDGTEFSIFGLCPIYMDTTPITLAYSDFPPSACPNWDDGIKATFYLLQGQTFANATMLYEDDKGQTKADSSYYTDGDIRRSWNGTGFQGTTESCPKVKPVTLAYSNFPPAACANWDTNFNRSTYYIPDNESFASATELYTDANAANMASASYYTNGTIKRGWNGSAFSSTENC